MPTEPTPRNPCATAEQAAPWHLKARILIGAATFFDAFDALAIAYVLPVLAAKWSLTPGQIAVTISLGYVGQVLGALGAGFFADRYGRLRALMGTVAILSLCSLLMALSWNWPSLLVFRLVQGIGLGGEVPVAASYITEIARARDRGRFVLVYELVFPLGVMAVGLAGFWIVPRFGWRWLFLLGGTAALLCLFMRRALPESPRWTGAGGSASARPVSAAELFSPRYRKRTLLVWTLWFTTYLAFYGMWTWLPSLYTSVYKLPLAQSLKYGLFMQCGGFVGALACAFLTDRVGRRPWIAGALLAGAVPLFVLGALGSPSAHALLLASVAAAPFIGSVASALYLYTPEIYPTRMRALGSSVASAWLRFAAILGPIVIGAVVARAPIGWAFAIFAAVLVVGGLAAAFFADETKGEELERLSP